MTVFPLRDRTLRSVHKAYPHKSWHVSSIWTSPIFFSTPLITLCFITTSPCLQPSPKSRLKSQSKSAELRSSRRCCSLPKRQKRSVFGRRRRRSKEKRLRRRQRKEAEEKAKKRKGGRRKNASRGGTEGR